MDTMTSHVTITTFSCRLYKIPVFVIVACVLSSSSLFAVENTFNVSLQIYSPVKIAHSKNISFPVVESRSIEQILKIEPADNDAGNVLFENGSENKVTYSIVESEVHLENMRKPIVINHFKLKSKQDQQQNRLLTTVRIGATVTLPAHVVSNVHDAEVTLSLVYQ